MEISLSNQILIKRNVVSQNGMKAEEPAVIQSSEVKSSEANLANIYNSAYGQVLVNRTKTQTPQQVIHQQTKELCEEFEQHIQEVKNSTHTLFDDIAGEKGIISSRIKGYTSILPKLEKKMQKGELNINQSPEKLKDDCRKIITDAYGSRVSLAPIDGETAKEVCKNAEIDFEDMQNALQIYVNGGEKPSNKIIEVIEKLKTLQTQALVERLNEQKNNPNFRITEINNYGDEISSYMTYDQIKSIATEINNPKLFIITKVSKKEDLSARIELVNEKTGETEYHYELLNDEGNSIGEIDEENSEKKSGYVSTQFNIEYKFKDGTVGYGELQVRSTLLNEFAEAEHVIYDTKQAKAIQACKYPEIYNLVKNMAPESINKYNQYLKGVYTAIRMKELGFDIEIPILQGEYKDNDGIIIDNKEMQKLSYYNLIELHNKK